MLSQPFDLVGCVLSTPGGVGVEGAAVAVLDASKKPPVSLGAVTTDERGVFRLVLDTAQLALPGCDGCHTPPRLVFEVQKGGKTLPLQAREVLWKVVPHAPAEFEEIASALTPRLGATPAHALDAAEVRDLACATKIPSDRVARFARAARFAERTGLLPEVFYALLGGAPDAPLAALLSADVVTWKLRLRAAIEQRQIVLPAGLDVEAVAAQLRGAAVRERLLAPGTLDPSALARVLTTALPNAAQREALLALMAAHQGEPAAFWTALAANATFDDAVAHLQAALQFSALAGGHAPLVEVLQQQRIAGTIPTLRTLAGWNHAAWVTVLESSPTPGGPIVGAPLYIEGTTEEERQDRYADTLLAAMEVAFPSAFVAARYAEEAVFPGQGDVVKFLSEQVAFELTETNFEDYVEATPSALIDITDVALLKANVEKTQRLYKLAPAYETMKALSDEGYGSCEQIAREDIEVFAGKTSAALGGTEVAYEFHNQATVVAAAAMTIVAQLQGASPASMPASIPSRPTSVPGFPGYAALFGEGDYCACEECRSVFGPAAYLVDPLEFLRSQPALAGTAKDALFARRADIGRVALTCHNTRKRVPYIDLVNEILERAVTTPAPPALPASIETTGSEAERGATRLAVMESVTRAPAAPSGGA